MSGPRAEYAWVRGQAGDYPMQQGTTTVVRRAYLLLAPADAARLRRCEAWPVIGCEGMVDVRMPADVWERVKGENTCR